MPVLIPGRPFFPQEPSVIRVSAWRSALLALLIVRAATASGQPDTLSPRLLVGYWHNFTNGAGAFRLTSVPSAYDVVDVAFAVSSPSGGTMVFTPAPEIYASDRAFIADAAVLQSQGKKVLISVGGANSVVQLNSEADIQNFVSSMSSIITTFGFDGVDIDLEGQSISLIRGDTDFRNPTSPLIVNMIRALNLLFDQFPKGLLLTMAPETAFVQGGYSVYQGIFGAYLPLIYALRTRLTFIHVQDYNTGSMYGRDGKVYQPETADFHAAMADALLAGFPVDAFRQKSNTFPALAQNQVLIGLPASTNAASSGFTPSSVMLSVLDYLMKGKPYGGSYQIANPKGYWGFRGLMTWSINWDVFSKLQFSNAYRTYLDTVVTAIEPGQISDLQGSGFALDQNYPNPFNPSTVIGMRWPASSRVKLAVYDMLGRQVSVLMDGVYAAGNYTERFDARGLASGVYLFRLSVNPLASAAENDAGRPFVASRLMTLVK